MIAVDAPSQFIELTVLSKTYIALLSVGVGLYTYTNILSPDFTSVVILLLKLINELVNWLAVIVAVYKYLANPILLLLPNALILFPYKLLS